MEKCIRYIEDRQSKVLYQLNKDYLELYYSPSYQKYLKREKLKKIIKENNWKEFVKIVKGRISQKKLVCKSLSLEHWEKKKELFYVNLPKVVVYTCIVGNYDDLDEPFYSNPNIDYVVFTDMEVCEGSVWKKRDLRDFDELKGMTQTEINRFIKLHPHIFFPEYDFSVYLDGTILIIADIMPIVLDMHNRFLGVHKHAFRDCIFMEAEGVIYSKRANPALVNQQMQTYRSSGYPVHNGLYENTILVRNHNRKVCIKIMNKWWNEYKKFPTRDQLSLPYILWQEKVTQSEIYILGESIEKNYRFRRKLYHKSQKEN